MISKNCMLIIPLNYTENYTTAGNLFQQLEQEITIADYNLKVSLF